ncbi:MAG: ABC transporter permease [Acidobacteria bacterium]|nr:ABC transporter permease [Acidobacteriota bacterium]
MRHLRRTWLATLIIAIGAGTAAAVMAAHYRLAAEAIPYADADRLFTIPGAWITYSAAGATIGPELENARAFEAVGVYQQGAVTLSMDDGPRRVVATSVNAGFFAVFREAAFWGRVLGRDDPVGTPHAVVSFALGQRLLASSVGGTLVIRIDGRPFTVVGVMPERFGFPSQTQVWVPFRSGSQATEGRGSAKVIARLAGDATYSDARETAVSQLPAFISRASAAALSPIRSLRDEISQGVLPVLRTLLLLCLLLLAATCVDVAGLGIVAASIRSDDLTIRMVLGATRRQLIGQMLKRATATALVAGIAGSAIAVVLWRVFNAATRDLAPNLDLVTLDWRLFVYAAATAALATAALVAGELFAVVRLDRGSRPLVMAARSRVAGRLRRVIIAGQVAVAFILVSVTLATTEALVRAGRVDDGFGVRQAVSLDLTVPHSRYPTAAAIGQLVQRIEEQVRQWLGPVAVGLTDVTVGQDLVGFPVGLEPAGERAPVGASPRSILFIASATPGYFDAAGIRVIAGRTPGGAPGDTTARGVAISEAAAKLLGLRPEEVVGRNVFYAGTQVQVVGVVSDVRLLGPHNDAPAVAYHRLGDGLRSPHVVTVLAAGAGATIPALTEALHDFDPDIATFNARNVSDYMSPFLRLQQLVQRLATAASVLAILLAAVAVYGLMSFEVTSRRREIALRLALGESTRSVRLRFSRAAGMMATVGILAGLLLHYILWQVVGSVSNELREPSWVTLGASAVAMFVLALRASSGPASQAVAISPATVLKTA